MRCWCVCSSRPQLGFTSTRANLLTVPVYVFACIVTLVGAWVADRYRQRGYLNLYVLSSGRLHVTHGVYRSLYLCIGGYASAAHWLDLAHGAVQLPLGISSSLLRGVPAYHMPEPFWLLRKSLVNSLLAWVLHSTRRSGIYPAIPNTV
jgi:hypothetical protein